MCLVYHYNLYWFTIDLLLIYYWFTIDWLLINYWFTIDYYWLLYTCIAERLCQLYTSFLLNIAHVHITVYNPDLNKCMIYKSFPALKCMLALHVFVWWITGKMSKLHKQDKNEHMIILIQND